MTVELIMSLISLGLSTACSILTILVNIKISKINNIESRYKYEKQIILNCNIRMRLDLSIYWIMMDLEHMI